LWGCQWSQSNTSDAKYTHYCRRWCLRWELYLERTLNSVIKIGETTNFQPSLFYYYWSMSLTLR
jgi:hypothetical protein